MREYLFRDMGDYIRWRDVPIIAFRLVAIVFIYIYAILSMIAAEFRKYPAGMTIIFLFIAAVITLLIIVGEDGKGNPAPWD